MDFERLILSKNERVIKNNIHTVSKILEIKFDKNNVEILEEFTSIFDSKKEWNIAYNDAIKPTKPIIRYFFNLLKSIMLM
jgi:hypothetical protein